MLCMCLEDDAEVVGEERASHFLTTGEMTPPMFIGDLAVAEAYGFWNMLTICGSEYAATH